MEIVLGQGTLEKLYFVLTLNVFEHCYSVVFMLYCLCEYKTIYKYFLAALAGPL